MYACHPTLHVFNTVYMFQEAVLRHKAALGAELARRKIKAKASSNAELLGDSAKQNGKILFAEVGFCHLENLFSKFEIPTPLLI